jgi:hypothetical protein
VAPAGNAPASRVLQTRANLSQLEGQSELTLTVKTFQSSGSFRSSEAYHERYALV